MLERLFRLSAFGTTVRTEVMAGITTFLTMAYIISVNPQILSEAGMPHGAVFVATCLAAAFGSLVMGLYANAPIAIAPGMGLNAYFTYVVVLGMGHSWQVALGAVFISGLFFLGVTLLGVRGAIVNSIPPSVRIGITAGIGLFLAIIALKSSGLVVASPATLVTMGDLHKPEPLLAVFGFFTIAALSVLGVRGALLIGILAVTGLSFVFAGNTLTALVALPPPLAPTLLAMDLKGALDMGVLNVILVFFLVELFDATGTLMGVARRAKLLEDKSMQRLNRALFADSASIVVGGGLGTSSATAYLESASGVQEGGRTGLVAVTVAVLFLLSLFFAPLAAAVPAYATAPALLFVACLMLRDLGEIAWDDVTEAIPAVVTALMMPFTYSIANGVACGFISYAGIKLLTGRAREVHWLIWLIAAAFLFKYAYEGTGG